MRKPAKLSPAFFFFLLLLQLSSYGQYEYENVFNTRTGGYETVYNPYSKGQQDYERNIRNMNESSWKNIEAINQRARENTEALNRIMEDAMDRRMQLTARLNYGNAIIRAGKATTTYKSSSNFSLKNFLLQQAETPVQKQLAEQYTDICLKQFHAELTTNGMGLNDYADGVALTFILSYEVYFGVKPSKAHLAVARKYAKSGYLKDAVFQSYDDEERRSKIEADEVVTQYARIISGKGDSNLVKEAKFIAKAVLEKIWFNSVETILMTKTSFIHKGQQFINDGKATNLYTYNPNIQTAEMNVKNPDKDFREKYIQERKQMLQSFYQVLEQKGGQKNDLAWCATMIGYAEYYVLSNGQEMNGVQLKNVYEFIKKSILKSPDVQAASNEAKQIACETMAISAVSDYKDFLKEDTKGVSIATARVNLRSLFLALNEDINNYQWTEQGIERIKPENKL